MRMAGWPDREFDEFVLARLAGLVRFAYALTGDLGHAEDIVQTALVKVYLQWPRVESDPGPWSYARRAVVNVAIDESRRPWRREDASDALPDRAAPESRGLDDAMVEALSGLPARQRAVVVLRYVEGLDIDETAVLLGISAGTVKSQAARGLDAMRRRLAPAASAKNRPAERSRDAR
jgi:RNA polymerase sigma-70 factor (sigma-E family)